MKSLLTVSRPELEETHQAVLDQQCALVALAELIQAKTYHEAGDQVSMENVGLGLAVILRSLNESLEAAAGFLYALRYSPDAPAPSQPPAPDTQPVASRKTRYMLSCPSFRRNFPVRQGKGGRTAPGH